MKKLIFAVIFAVLLFAAGNCGGPGPSNTNKNEKKDTKTNDVKKKKADKTEKKGEKAPQDEKEKDKKKKKEDKEADADTDAVPVQVINPTYHHILENFGNACKIENTKIIQLVLFTLSCIYSTGTRVYIKYREVDV